MYNFFDTKAEILEALRHFYRLGALPVKIDKFDHVPFSHNTKRYRQTTDGQNIIS